MNTLAERIEVGEIHRTEVFKVIEHWGVKSEDVFGAMQGSLDAALSLFEQVLLGWEWCINSEGKQGYLARVLKPGEVETFAGALAKTPAAALVAAIVRAKETDT